MNKIIVFMFLILVYKINWSQVFMNIKNKDGTTQSFNIEDIQKLTFDGVVNVEDGEKLSTVIKTFTLLQNYPNPFNPSTTIEYQIPTAGGVEVNIYNVSGQLIKTIENSYKNEGTHKVSWDSKNENGQIVSSGIYLLQVKFKNTLLVKKLMLIK